MREAVSIETTQGNITEDWFGLALAGVHETIIAKFGDDAQYVEDIYVDHDGLVRIEYSVTEVPESPKTEEVEELRLGRVTWSIRR